MVMWLCKGWGGVVLTGPECFGDDDVYGAIGRGAEEFETVVYGHEGEDGEAGG